MNQFPELADLTSMAAVRALSLKFRLAAVDRARRSRFYSGRLPPRERALEDWHRIPFTTKQNLRDAYPFGLLAVDRSSVATYHESSGTSGEPTASFLTDADWREIVSRFGRNAAAIGPGDVVLVKTPYSLVTTAHQMHATARARGAMVVPADNRSTMIPYSRVIRLLDDLGVTVTWSLPNEAVLWALAALAAGKSPSRDFPALRTLLVAGEPLTVGRRAMISRAWGNTSVRQDYGSTETCSLAGECPVGALHFWADRFYAEIFDPRTGEAHERGTGELVVTSLFAEAMPLIRYNVGDWVTLSDSPCACGWPLPTINVGGRARDRMFVGDAEFLPSALEDAVYAGAEYELVLWRGRSNNGALEIEYESPSAGDLTVGIEREIRHRLGISVLLRRVDAGTLVPTQVLTEPVHFSKPCFVLAAGEPWNESRLY